MAVTTKDGVEASGMEADSWSKIMTTKQFGNKSNELYTAIFKVNKKLCKRDSFTQSLEAFFVWRFIPLDKNSGLHLIGL